MKPLWLLITLTCLCAAAHAQTNLGSALSFNGAGQRVHIADFFTNAPTTEVTVEFWQNASGLRAQSSFSQDDSSRGEWDPHNVFNAHVPYSDGRVYWDFGDIGGEGRLYYTPPVSIVGSWQHFAFVASQSGNFMRIYRNGILEAEKAGITPFTRGSFDLDIAGENNYMWDVSFSGILDEFRIWDVARSQAEIEQFMHRSLPLPQTNLVAYWPFDEGTGGVAHDASGNGQDGILVNGPQWYPPDPRNLWIEANVTNVAVGYPVSFIARDVVPMLQTLWDFGDGTLLTNQLSATHAWTALGVYTVRLTGYCESYPTGVSATVTVHVVEQPVHYVAANSLNPSPPYNSWATAAKKIQDAVDVASVPGSLVLVSNGLYATGGRAVGGTMTNRVAVTKPLTVRSVNGPEFTIIQGAKTPGGGNGDGAIRCVYLTNGASLYGFTLINGVTRAVWDDYPYEDRGGGVWCESTNAVVSNCVLTGNSALIGGGAYGGTLCNCTLTANRASFCGGASAGTLYKCRLTGNSAAVGGGAAWNTLNNCTLSGNSADSYGGGAYQNTLNNCALTGNSAGRGGGGAEEATLCSCTLTGNAADQGGGVYACALTNCIVYFNSAPLGPNYFDSTLEYCCTTPVPTNGVANFDADPRLAGDTHLSVGSPCRGAGNAVYASGTDIDGEAWSLPPSVGCDEYRAGAITGPLHLAISTDYTNVAAGFRVNFTAHINGRPGASVWDFGDGAMASNRPYASHAWTVAGDYPVVLHAYNDSYPAGLTATVVIRVVEGRHFVAAGSASPVAPYTSWTTAARNIQEAVDAASPGALVLVSNGVYAAGGRAAGTNLLVNRVAVDKPLTVRSVNGPQVTVIKGYQVPGTTNGDGAIRCVYLPEGASLSGFTLTNGATRTAGDWERERNGGGVWCASTNAVLTNCVLIGNSAAGSGGGTYVGTLHNCMLRGNSAPYGGGANSATLNDCTLINNSANGPHYAGEGGGARGSTLNNCTLSDNSANVGGGAYHSALKNCTLTGNSASEGGGAAGGTLNNCTLTGNSASGAGGGAAGGTLNNCTLTGNSASGGGGGASGGTLNNCTLTGNSASGAGGGASGGTLNNCTLTGNSASEGGGAFLSKLRNCIVYFNRAPSGANYGKETTFEYSCTTPLPPGGGNLADDPQLASPTHLSPLSPCVGAGSPVYASGLDIDGEPWASPPAMGADQPGLVTGPLSVLIVVAFTQTVIGYPVTFTAQVSGPILQSVWDFGDGTVLTNQPFACHAWGAPGTYTVRLTGYNASHPAGVTATLTVTVGEEVACVDAASANPVFPYASWATAARTIPEAIRSGTLAGRLVLVTNGVYRAGVVEMEGMNRVAITNPVVVRSVNGPDATWIDGNHEARCAYVGDGAVLSGFTVTNGRAQYGGGVWCGTFGVVTNCVITSNLASGGGGAYGGTLSDCTLTANSAWDHGGGADSSTLNNCTLTGNSAYWGGGACGGTLNNCTLSGNVALDRSYGFGGGAYASTLNSCLLTGNSAWGSGGGALDCTLNNCTLTNNSAWENGGGACGGSLYNCVLAGNSAEWGSGGGAYQGSYQSCLLWNCTLTCNRAGNSGGGTYGGSLYNCTLSGNSARYGGGAAGYLEATLGGCYRCGTFYNCILTGNSAEEGGGAYGGTFYNCTLTGNSATYRGGGVAGYWGWCWGGCWDDGPLYNCILYFNTAPDGPNHSDCTVNYCCTTPLPANGAGNITNAPLFLDTNGWRDLHPQPDSPCINAGDNSSVTINYGIFEEVWFTNRFDMDGMPRILGGTVDMGAYEFNPNVAPTADASATSTLVISPNGVDATVVLDGSRSSDPDGDPLQYFWLSTLNPQPSTVLASGLVAVVRLPVGVHPILLVVSDGLASATNSITVEVITPVQAVQRLIAQVESRWRRSQPLIASLSAALRSIERGNSVSAINQLQAFQNKVQAQVAPSSPALAAGFLQTAQEIIDALSGGQTNPGGRPHGRLTATRHPANGHVQLQLMAEPGAVRILEASTDLVHWEKIGIAHERGDGTITFDDPNAAQFPNRFYRVVSP